MKGVYAERFDVDVTSAFTTMRAHARSTSQPLRSVATQIIDGTFDPSVARRP